MKLITTVISTTKKEIDSFPGVLSLVKLACKFAARLEEELTIVHSDDERDEEREEPILALRREPQPSRKIAIETKAQKWTVAMIKSVKFPHRSGVLSYTNFPTRRIPDSSIYHDSDSYNISNTLRVAKANYD